MTYNFDPDMWYDNEYTAIAQQYKTRTITKTEFETAIKSLQARLEDMWNRLDGSYRIAGTTKKNN